MSGQHADIWSHPSHYGLYLTHTVHHCWITLLLLIFHLALNQSEFCLGAIRPFLAESKFPIWPWKLKVKLITKVQSDGPIWGLNFNPYVCFLFCGNWTIFGWDRVNSIFGQGHGQGQTGWSHLWPKVQSICLIFVNGNWTIFGWDIASPIFYLEIWRTRSLWKSNKI